MVTEMDTVVKDFSLGFDSASVFFCIFWFCFSVGLGVDGVANILSVFETYFHSYINIS